MAGRDAEEMTKPCNTCKHYVWKKLIKWCRAWGAEIGDLWEVGCDQYLDAYAKTGTYVDGKHYPIGGET